jgi:hypothetical protein
MKQKLLLFTAMLLAGSVCFGGLSLYPYYPYAWPVETVDPGSPLILDPVLWIVPDTHLLDFDIPGGVAIGAIELSVFQPPSDYILLGLGNLPLNVGGIAIFQSYFNPDAYLFFLDPETQQPFLLVQTDPTPEPATLSLMALGGLALLRKRK